MGIRVLQPGTVQSAVLGWCGSRNLDETPTGGAVARVDASVNELPSALFYFEDMMILERELVVTPRNHVIWARTSRVDDPLKFKAAFGFICQQHETIIDDMRKARDAGHPQDQWRMMLPLCSLTSWTARLSLRDAVRLVNYFGDVARFIEPTNYALSERLFQTSRKLQELLRYAFGITQETESFIMRKYKRMNIPTSSMFAPSRIRFGDYTAINMNMPIALRAQLYRHREIIVSDNFVEMLGQPFAEQCDLRAQVTVQAVALNTVWRDILGKRTCWMAQSELWAPLVKRLGYEGNDGLPCADGVCPFAEDAKLRLVGRDPGAPCPRYASLSGIPLTAEQFAAGVLHVERTSNPEMWRHEIEHAPLKW